MSRVLDPAEQETATARGASKSRIARDWIRERIRTRAYGPGYRLVLSSIADELEMSVVPVREAIRLLEAEGLVEFERNVGARVALVDTAEYIETMETLGVMEGVATSLSAHRLTEDELAHAEAVNERMRTLLDHFDSQHFSELNQQFHSVLFQHCPNRQMLDIVHRSWIRMSGIRDSIFAFIPDRSAESVREHGEILALIRAQAPVHEIEQAVRAHRWNTLHSYLESRD